MRFDKSKRWHRGSAPHDPIEACGIRPVKGKLNFGIELELRFADRDDADIHDEIYNRVGGACTIGYDADGLEIRSVPLVLCDAQEYLTTLLDPTLPTVQSLEDHYGCGMHVHMSKEVMTSQHLLRFLQFMCNKSRSFQRFTTWIAGRSTSPDLTDADVADLGTIVETEAHYGWLPNIYGALTYNLSRVMNIQRSYSEGWQYLPTRVVEEQMSHHFTPLDELNLDSLLMGDDSDRPGIAINTHHGTHEMRFFNATTEAARAKANVQFLDALYHYTKDDSNPVDSIVALVEYCTHRDGIYPDFSRRLQESASVVW